jgi:hypothetical protein
MKRNVGIAIFLCLLAISGMALAASTANVTVRAVVPSSLDLTATIRSAPPGGDPFGPGSADATSLDFGTLTFDTTNHIWIADKYFTVFLIASTSGKAYTLQQTNNGVVATGGGDLNSNMIMTPDNQTNDQIAGVPQGLMPAGDSLGTAALSFGTNKIIYNGNSGLSRIVRSYYGLSTGAPGEPTGSLPITTNKPSGTYNGTVTFSVVLK